jgi:amino acid adenylation domain-containing protein
LEQQLGYWAKQLADVPVTHGLPLDKERPTLKKHKGQVVSKQISKAISEQLNQLARAHQLTPFMLFHSALSLVLSRHSNSQDIVIGTPVANRKQAELEPLIGFFVNTLVLRVDTSYQTLSEYLAHVRKVNIDAQAHQDIPFEQLVELCKIPRSRQHTPLFQIMFMMNTNKREALTLSKVNLSAYERSGVSCKFDLEINVVTSDEGITFNWVYDESLFTHEHITSLSEHLTRLLSAFAEDSVTEVTKLPILSEQEVYHLTHTLNDTHADYPNVSLFHQLFEAQVTCQPDGIALVFGDSTMTYDELNTAANRLAYYLQERGVTTETLVGICVERSMEMVVGILAVLKAGGAYVPLDPQYPRARLQYMLDDTQLKHLLSQAEVAEKLVFSSELDVVLLDDLIVQKELSHYSANNPAISTQQHTNNLAYVIYTSGSTGQPNGVMVEHKSLINTIVDNASRVGMQSGSTSYQATSIAFDASMWLIWNTLTVGGTVRLASTLSFQSELTQYKDVTHLFMTPSMLENLEPDACPFIDVVMVGGESFSQELVSRWMRQGKAFLNAYGPTEVTIVSSMSSLAQNVRPHIGKPGNNVQYLIMNNQRQLVPLGTIGELYIGGDGLARGYLNQPELTNERFIQNPYSTDPQSRLYKTGDLARYLGDGNVEFIGRNDEQVKIRGFRIELGEIESALNRCTNVNTCVVVVTGESSERQLVGYVTVVGDNADQGRIAGSLKAQLQQQLPSHLVPSIIIVLASLPLTPNGKVDKAALPKPDSSSIQGDYVAPATETEYSLAQIWSKLLKLKVEEISTTANFFDVGGHSLLAIRLMSEIKRTLEQEINIYQLFEHVSIKSMASILDAQDSKSVRAPAIRPLERDACTPMALSFAQQRLWMIDQLQGGSPEYNMPMVVRVSGHFNLPAAETAMCNIIKRHQVLRTVFDTQDDEPVQVIRDNISFLFVRHNLCDVAPQEIQEHVAALVQQDISTPFDLSHDVMVRAAYIQLSFEGNDGVLLFNIHHIASDGWSMGLLIKEFAQEYEAALSGKVSPIPELEIQYADYAHWQRQWQQGEVIEAQLNYWIKQLEGIPAIHCLPLDNARPAAKKHKGQVISYQVDKDTSERLRQLAKTYQLTPFMLLHAGLALVLSKHSNSHDIVIGTPVANRMQAELETLIGFFVNTLVLRVDTSEQTLSEFFAHVRKVNLDAQAHQDVPFEQLVEHCNVLRSRQHTPLFQIMFSMNTNEQASLTLPGLSFSAYERNGISCKFDLDINAVISEQGIAFNWVYDQSLFSHQHITSMAEHLGRLLSAFTDSSLITIQDLPMLSEQEVYHLIHKLNDTKVPYPSSTCVHQLFEAQAISAPESLALVFGKDTMTYQALNASANRLAHYLREQGVSAHTLVGVCLERSLEMVVGIIAVLKAGGAYVPLDPSYPKDRLEYMLADSQIRCVLSQTALLKRLTALRELDVLYLDAPQLQATLAHYPTENLSTPEELNSGSLAYVIYTSGSTGQPKGVMVEHGGLVNTIVDNTIRLHIDANSSLYQATSTAFDAAIWVMWNALTTGAKVRLASALSFQSELIEYADVTHLFMTPSMLASLQAQACPFIQTVVVGGESCPYELVKEWVQEGKTFFNGYGPTEISICSSIGELSNESRTHIGKPNNNVQYLILNDSLQLVPKGTIGELYIGGAGLARGYLNRPELTKERFIQHPFDDNSQSRLYRTGDLVRYIGDGNVEFIGRNDEQVKIRGFRVELDEIERALNQCREVKTSVVLTYGETAGQSLIGYVTTVERGVAGTQQLIESIQSQLQAKLPNYMVPTTIIALDSFPLTPNGKVDKAALPAPESSMLRDLYVAPETNTERVLTQIWSRLFKLDAESISVKTDFYQLGGHSLLLVKLLYAIQSTFEKAYELTTLSRDHTIQAQALRLDSLDVGLDKSGLLDYINSPDEAERCIIFIPGAAGTARDIVEITNNLVENNVAVAVFRHQGLIAGEQYFTSIEENVAAFEKCLATKAYSKLTLVGHSYGGVLAVELAKRLVLMGYKVNVVMLDTYFEQHKLQHLSPSAVELDITGIPEFARNTLQHQAKLFANYRPGADKQIPISVLLATESPYSSTQYKSYLSEVFSDHRIQYSSVAGDHFSMLRGESAEAIAKIIINKGN